MYSYTNNQVTGITINGTALLSGVSYEPFGPARGWTWGNTSTEVRLYNTDGNPTMISGIESVSLGYDNAFWITSASNSSNSALSWSYGYDLLDRLTSASEIGTSLGWTYDTNGNRTQQTGATASNVLSNVASYTYNGRGRMASATVGSTTSSYIYNALGQRISKTRSTTVLFMYDEVGHLIGEYDGSGNLLEETIWLGDLPVATIQPNGSGISIYYVHANQLGAPIMITRPADNVIMWRWDADPLGTVTPNQNPSGLGTFSYNLRFPGQYYRSADVSPAYNGYEWAGVSE